MQMRQHRPGRKNQVHGGLSFDGLGRRPLPDLRYRLVVTAEVDAWLAEHGVADPRVVHRLESATTADLFAIDDLVLRWYAGGTFLLDEPDALRREVAALTILGNTPVPAPRLVAWSAEPPVVLMTRLSGGHRLDVADPGAVRGLLEQIHAVDPEPFARWSYRGYHEGVDLPAPVWWRDGGLWDRALRISAAGPPAYEPVFIHRDFHPGNLLWTTDDISGVIDWGNACLGPAAFDLAHYRVNLATLVGPQVADIAFAGDPAWDIEAALGYVDPWSPDARDVWEGPWPQVSASVARDRLEAFIARAVASRG
jgi:aminoglycoside phosphotransferase (APT) family kinase protein